MQTLVDHAWIERQECEYSDAIHTNDDIPADVIDNIRSAAEALQPSSKYREYSEVRFLWEMLELKDSAAQIRAVVDGWVRV